MCCANRIEKVEKDRERQRQKFTAEKNNCSKTNQTFRRPRSKPKHSIQLNE